MNEATLLTLIFLFLQKEIDFKKDTYTESSQKESFNTNNQQQPHKYTDNNIDLIHL